MTYHDLLALNAVSGQLAPTLYYAAIELYPSTDLGLWSMLDGRTKQQWVERAALLLASFNPNPKPQPDYFALASDLARTHATNVVGRITPSEPYGVSSHE